MASSWATYSPDSLPTGDVKPDASHPTKASSLTPPVWNSNATYPDRSDLARELLTVSSELVEPAAKLACIEMPSMQGRAGAFASSAIAFTSTTGSPSGTTIKTSPIVVSTTPLRVKFRETGPPTLLPISLDKQPTHSVTSTLQIEDGLSARPGVHTDVKAQMTTVRSPDATIATRGCAPSTEPFPINPEPQPTSLPPPMSLRPELPPMPSSSPYDVDSSARHTSTPKHPYPISAATNVAPQPRQGSTNANSISTTNISGTNSPTVGALPYTPPSVTLSPNLDLEREKLEGRYPKRSVTGGSSGTPSIVRSSYMNMKLEEVPRLDCILSFIFTWLLLAGFVVLPGTFNTLEGIQSGSTRVERVLHTIQHLPLYVPSFHLIPLIPTRQKEYIGSSGSLLAVRS